MNTPALQDLQYQKSFLSVFDHPFMMPLMKRTSSSGKKVYRQAFLQEKSYRNGSIEWKWS